MFQNLLILYLKSCPVIGGINADTAETPKAIEPTRFNNAILHEIFPICHDSSECPTSNHTSPLAIKKQMEPKASGAHTR